MKKGIFAAVSALFLLASVGTGFAATINCTVDSVEEGDGGYKVMMICDDKDAKGLEKGDKVKVRTKKGAAIEGC